MKYFLDLIEYAKKDVLYSSSSSHKKNINDINEKFSNLNFIESKFQDAIKTSTFVSHQKSSSIAQSKTEECTFEEMANHQTHVRMTNFSGEHIVNMLLDKFKSPLKSAVGTIPIYQTESSMYLEVNTANPNPDFMPLFSNDQLTGIIISIVNDPIREHFILEINFRTINAFKNG